MVSEERPISITQAAEVIIFTDCFTLDYTLHVCSLPNPTWLPYNFPTILCFPFSLLTL